MRLPGLTVPPLRRVTFGSCPKSNQKVLPLASGFRCAKLPSLHHCSRGPPRRAIPGPSRLSRHPCRSTPYTTIPLGLLMGRLASSVRLRVKSRADDCRLWSRSFCFSFCCSLLSQAARSPGPVRRLSGGAVERGVWHGCQTRNDGPWMAHRDDPRSSAGAREVWRSQTRMPGALSLWLLSLSRKQRESDSP